MAIPSIRTIKIHRKRAFLIHASALALAVLTSLRKLNDGAFAVAIAGLIYRLTANPGINSRKGWMSVRGAILTIGSIAMIWISLTAILVFVLVQYGRDVASDNASFGNLGDITDEFDQLSQITIHFMNVVVGELLFTYMLFLFIRLTNTFQVGSLQLFCVTSIPTLLGS